MNAALIASAIVAEMRRVVGVAERLRRLGGGVGLVVGQRGVDDRDLAEAVAGVRAAHAAVGGAAVDRRAPVAEALVVRPDVAGLLGGVAVDEGLHRRVVLGERGAVAVLLVERPGQHDLAAGHVRVLRLDVVGRQRGARRQVLEVLGVEAVHAELARRRVGVGLDVHRGRRALVAHRRVGRRRHRVVDHAPAVHRPDPVQQRVGGLEAAGRGDVGVRHAAVEAVQRRRAGEAGHLDVAEPVVGEPGLVGLRPAAGQRVRVGRLRAAVGDRVEHAVGRELLRGADAHLSRRPVPLTRSRSQPAMFCPRSNTYTPGRGWVSGDRLDRVHDPHRRRQARDELAARRRRSR